MELKKNSDLSKFHKFIQKSVDSGLISRQEAVSMIPPMLLNTKSNYFLWFDLIMVLIYYLYSICYHYYLFLNLFYNFYLSFDYPKFLIHLFHL